MSDKKYSKAFMDKIFPAIHKKINKGYISSNQIKSQQLELEKLTEIHRRHKSEACEKVDELVQKRKMVEKKKQEESVWIASIIEQNRKQIEKIQVRNDDLKKQQYQMDEMTKTLEESVDILNQKKGQYLQHLIAYKPCKDLIKEVTKLWPTVVVEYELLQRLETLIKQKMRFSEEYKVMSQLHEDERKKLLYEDAEIGMIILSNKLDELEKEHKDVTVEIGETAEKFNRIMDTSSEEEAAFSEIRLGCLRLYHLTQPGVKTLDPVEQLTIVLEFGQLLRGVSECLGKTSKT